MPMRTWRATVIWSWMAIALYVAISVAVIMYFPPNSMAQQQLTNEVPAFVYEVSMSAFFTAMCMNLTSFLMESSRAKRQLALLCGITKGMAAFSDLLVLAGRAGWYYGPGNVLINANRFVQWLVTTPTMIFMLAQISPFSKREILTTIGADVLMVASGVIASVAPSLWSAVFFMLAMLLFLFVMRMMSRMILATMQENDTPTARRNLLYTMYGTIVCWSLFPACWLTPWCMLPVSHALVAEVITVASNFLSKVLLSTSLIYGNYAVLDERDKQDMQTLILEMRTNLSHLEGERDELMHQQEVLQAELDVALRNYTPDTVIDEGTPADKILQILMAILDGKEQVMGDVVYVRNIIMETKDIYVPLDLTTQLQASKLDADVSTNLLNQLTNKPAVAPERSTDSQPLYPSGENGMRMSAPLQLNSIGDEETRGLYGSLTQAIATIMDVTIPSASPSRPGSLEAIPPSQDLSGLLSLSCISCDPLDFDTATNDLLDVSLSPKPDPAAGQRSSAGHRGLGVSERAAMLAAQAAVVEADFPLVPSIVLQVERVLASACKWQFNVFALTEASDGHPLSTLAYFLFHTSGLISAFAIEGHVLARFLKCIEEGYGNNPYHSCSHAADVLQTYHVILHGAGLVPGYADRLMLMACYLAAVVHDFEHGGRTNDFLAQANDPLALRYNDRACLENHHLAAAFTLLRKPQYNFLAHLQKSDTDRLRKSVIDLVLSTDMKQHFSSVSLFNAAHRNASNNTAACTTGLHSTRISRDVSRAISREMDSVQVVTDFDASGLDARMKMPCDESERLLSLQMALKCADIGHLSAELKVHIRWVQHLEEEFFRQGDAEKALGLAVSPLFDRCKPGITKSQVGFFDVVAIPLFRSFTKVFIGAKPLLTQVLCNYHLWGITETYKTWSSQQYWQQHQLGSSGHEGQVRVLRSIPSRGA